MYFRCRDITYVHAPKVGSRSILGWFSILGNPQLYRDHPEYFKPINTEDHVYSGIRQRVNQTGTIETKDSFVVLRDPVRRFVSGYVNRVITHKELGSEYPDFDEFLNNLDYYKGVNNSIAVHLAPLSKYYGADKSRYSFLFRTEELFKLKEFLEHRFETKLPDLRLQQNKTTITPTKKQEEKIKELYKVDYINGWN